MKEIGDVKHVKNKPHHLDKFGIVKETLSLNRMRQNPWILTTIFLAIVLLVSIFFFNGAEVSAKTAEKNLVDFASAQGLVLEDVSATDKGSFYQLSFLVDGSESVASVTKDGKFLIQPVTALSSEVTETPASTTETTEVPKTDKPKADAFIFSYCPYGLQFEKALIPVYELLKNQADINIVAIGAMHGESEKVESLRQISVEKLYGKDKLFAYLKEFDYNTNIGSCAGDDACLDKYLPAIYTKLGIDKAKVESYMDKSAEAIYDAQGELASSLGIGGSPTFVVNGVQVQVGRTPAAIGEAICSAFTTEPPECSKTLSSEAFTPGFGGSSGTSSGASCN